MKPLIKYKLVHSFFDQFEDKKQWCVCSTNPRYFYDDGSPVFGHADTLSEAWVNYLSEIKEYEKYLQECDEPELSK